MGIQIGDDKRMVLASQLTLVHWGHYQETDDNILQSCWTSPKWKTGRRLEKVNERVCEGVRVHEEEETAVMGRACSP
ncbi:hypothetical protein E5676_scaffold13G002440 [Cucumis melo var. makuwa]|uniref:Uncharacterized protein n=2 Tax=Cucumis melo TaxID=3656 RepID=A0A5A7SL79_CUCMM|nr:hypothetical protein E6C27_scaffold139G002410 [Cucumis melo var. makuwa]TYK06933.1 hypothetical protein E5676_scaffold13G002440 [Cucumis melo var. makuwa]